MNLPPEAPTGAGYEYLHVCVDNYSRVAYVELLLDERGATAAAFLERASHHFASRDVTIERVLTDNGSGYLSDAFRDRCQQLQITHTGTRPRRPQTNGKAERFIQTLLREWAYASTPPATNAPQRCRPGSATTTTADHTAASATSRPQRE